MGPVSPAAWNDPYFVKAIFFLGVATAAAIIFVGLPALLRRGSIGPWLLLILVFSGLGSVAVMAQRNPEIAQSMDELHPMFRPDRPHGDKPRALDELLGLPNVFPKVERVLEQLPEFMVKLGAALEQLTPTLTQAQGMMTKIDPMLTELQMFTAQLHDILTRMEPALVAADKAGPVFEEAAPFLREATPLLSQASLVMTQMQPLLIDLRAVMGDTRAFAEGRDLPALFDRSARLLGPMEETLGGASGLFQDLAFLDENWLRHFLQVEGVIGYGKLGSPDIPKGSEPTEPPPLKK
ncbi:MAG: hypothetical protein KDH09_00500 [Chrysiogenetes bacterium]|nr:hypothetical protein [Chrysiogenetes bacterium]